MKSSAAVLGIAALVAAASAQTLKPIKERYKKYEYMVPMRDGVKLYTSVYVPLNMPGKHPILMERTPYGAGPYGPDIYRGGFRGSLKMQDAGYIFAFEDVRGKGRSEGDFLNVRPTLPKEHGLKEIDESTDTYDAVDYLIKNVPDNNGHMGLWGISYPGFYAGAGGINSHPALKAISPQAPVSDWFIGDDVHHNGAFFLQDNFSFSTFFDVPRGKDAPKVDFGTASAYDFYLKTGALPNFDKLHYKGAIPYWNDELMAHETYDQYWKDRSLPSHMTGVKCAVLTVGGFFDAEDCWGALNVYQHVQKQDPGTPNFLVMGPWYHGMWASPKGRVFGDLDYGQDTSTYFQDSIEFPFFEKYLRDQKWADPAKATVFETGTNKWRTFNEWPPKGLKGETFYLGNGFTLATAKPPSVTKASYAADPANPTPYLADMASRRRTREYMIDDQHFAEKRSDVLTYKGGVLEKDLTVCGKVDVDLYVTTTGTDGDFVVKVIDVWPDGSTDKSPKGVPMAGYEQLVRGDIMRGKFRNSFEKPEPFVPGKPTRVHFTMNEMMHTFLAGHKLMIQVQSSWFPLVDRNPNQFLNIRTARDEDFKPARIEILSGGAYPSSVKLGVLGG